MKNIQDTISHNMSLDNFTCNIYAKANKLANNAILHSNKHGHMYFAGPYVFIIDYAQHVIVHESSGLYGPANKKWGTYSDSIRYIIYHLMVKENNNV